VQLLCNLALERHEQDWDRAEAEFRQQSRPEAESALQSLSIRCDLH
jgi:hypothetical protein